MESESGWALTKRLGNYLREVDDLKYFKKLHSFGFFN